MPEFSDQELIENLEAFLAILKGKKHGNRGEDDRRRAILITEFEKATALYKFWYGTDKPV
jgi:hypothetical protein